MHNAQIGLRLSDELVERVDAFTERLQRELPGASITRTDAIRTLLIEALQAHEAE